MACRVSAIGRRNRQSIVVVDVARSAGHVGMPVGKWEPSCAVVECRRRPIYRRMARCAVRTCKSRSGRWMHRIRGLLPGRQMAS
jgi:hypothetical protein